MSIKTEKNLLILAISLSWFPYIEAFYGQAGILMVVIFLKFISARLYVSKVIIGTFLYISIFFLVSLLIHQDNSIKYLSFYIVAPVIWILALSKTHLVTDLLASLRKITIIMFILHLMAISAFLFGSSELMRIFKIEIGSLYGLLKISFPQYPLFIFYTTLAACGMVNSQTGSKKSDLFIFLVGSGVIVGVGRSVGILWMFFIVFMFLLLILSQMVRGKLKKKLAGMFFIGVCIFTILIATLGDILLAFFDIFMQKLSVDSGREYGSERFDYLSWYLSELNHNRLFFGWGAGQLMGSAQRLEIEIIPLAILVHGGLVLLGLFGLQLGWPYLTNCKQVDTRQQELFLGIMFSSFTLFLMSATNPLIGGFAYQGLVYFPWMFWGHTRGIRDAPT